MINIYKYVRKLVTVIAILMSIYHLYAAAFGMPEAFLHRSRHLLFALVLIFALYPMVKKKDENSFSIIDGIWILLSLGAIGHLFLNYDYFMTRYPLVHPLTLVDKIGGVLLIILVLEACRRANGFLLSGLCSVFLVYAYIGPWLPGMLKHGGFTFEEIIDHLYSGVEGIFGIPIGVSATYIILFIIFGAFLEKSGIGQVFADFAMAIAGDKKGGAAKVAVVSSACMGTISGSAVANVVTTGAFTIPLMKKTGYRPEFAGAVEAVASTGGQIMPPIMGAAAFVLAEFSGISYSKVIIHAAIPAFLYFFAVFMGTHFEACKTGLTGLPKSELPSLKDVLIYRGYMFLPILLIIYLMLVGFTPLRAVLFSMVAVVLLSYVRRDTRMDFRAILAALEDGAINSLGTIIACAGAGIIIGVVSLTGLGLKFSSLIVALSGGNLLLCLFLAMICALILGMGLPTTAAYIIQAALIVPALIDLGVMPIAAHLFCFYFAIISAITPPVALASYAATGIANSDLMKTSLNAVKLGLSAYIVPFMFVFGYPLLMIGSGFEIVRTIITASIGIIALASSLNGWFNKQTNIFERIALFIASLCLISPEPISDIVGLVIFLIIAFGTQGTFFARLQKLSLNR